MNTETNGTNQPATWQDAADASAEAQEPNTTRETITDRIDIPADDERIAKALLVICKDVDVHRAEVEAAKASLKIAKGRLADAEHERDELIKAFDTHVMTIEGTFHVVTNYRTMTEQWFTEDGEFLKECAVAGEKLQVPLPLERTKDPLAQTGEYGDEDESSNDNSVPVPEFDNDKSYFDDGTNLVGDPDATEIDATRLFADAARPLEPETSEPPSKPTRRGKRV
jgi:hypothetical protein